MIKLVTLAKHSLRADITALTWQALRRAINLTVTSPYWIDFRTYLEEIHMADAFDEPFSTAERAALGAGHSLLRKVARMLVPVAESAAMMAPYLDWRRTEKEVLRNVTLQLRERGTMNINTHADLRAGISVGAYPDKGETGLGVWVWNNPSAAAVRRQLLDAADAGKLPVTWERSRIGWEALGNYAQLSEFSDHSAAAAWLIERLRELESTGLMKLIPALGMPVFGDTLAGDEGEARDD